MTPTTYKIDTTNVEQMNAYRLITETNQSFFLTGRAGTGKTTFVNYVIDSEDKNFVVLAPTGKAAMLVGGSTIHSYFGFKPGETTPRTMGKSQHLMQLSSVDAFIVDEVSMLRCDLLDAMDYTLRRALHSSLPFGGKQMIFCGDLYQLAPVVQKGNTADVEMLQTEYGTTDAYFYKAHVFDHLRLPKIEFRKVYRHENADFLSILDHVRMGEFVPEEIARLNSRIATPKKDDEPYVILSGRKNQVETINKRFLDEIDSPSYKYCAEVSGKFSLNENELPAENELVLKVGAQVMFCKNDMNGRWVNGTLGKVVRLTETEIVVMTDKGQEVKVEKVSWEKTTSKYDRLTKKMQREVQGVFIQYPIRLAWAMTIHKSQGATFDRMMLDLEKGGIFADGQLYVALTRVRSLEGLFLNAPIYCAHIRKNEEVKQFADNFNDADIINQAVSVGKELFELKNRSDYDAMASVYMRETLNHLTRMDVEGAYNMTKSMMQTMISDESLYGATIDVPMCPNCVDHSDWFNAIFSLYGNKFDEAMQYADQEWKSTNDTDMLYVKVRALSKLKRYSEADALFNDLVETQGDEWDFKTAYALALHNELCVGDPGLNVMQQVVVKFPKYKTGMRRFRELMCRKKRKLKMADEITNELALAFNSTMSDEDFARQVVACEEEDVQTGFIYILRKQVL